MNERMNINRKPGELFAISVYNEDDKLITLSYENELQSEIMDIIQTLALRGYTIKICYHYIEKEQD